MQWMELAINYSCLTFFIFIFLQDTNYHNCSNNITEEEDTQNWNYNR
jgi:hypothetical protein